MGRLLTSSASDGVPELVRLDCGETSPDEWSKGTVSFRPVSVFDVSQTGGGPLPELETDATGAIDDRCTDLCEASEELGISLCFLDATAWEYGSAQGVCHTETAGGGLVDQEPREHGAMAGPLMDRRVGGRRYEYRVLAHVRSHAR